MSVKTVKKRKLAVVKEEPHGIKVGDKIKWRAYSHCPVDYYTGVVMGMRKYNGTLNFRVKQTLDYGGTSSPFEYTTYIALHRIINN